MTDQPLDAHWTVLAGVVASNLLILGYPSALRGPRQVRQRRSRSPRASALTAAKPGMPLRSGLDADAAERAVTLLRRLLDADGVAITDLERVLAFNWPGFTGSCAHHHGPGSPIVTEATKRALSSGRTIVVRDADEFGCPQSGCPLRTAVVAPLLRNISERLVRLFGSRCALDIRSKPGEGTTVDLRIPLRRSPAAVAPLAASSWTTRRPRVRSCGSSYVASRPSRSWERRRTRRRPSSSSARSTTT